MYLLTSGHTPQDQTETLVSHYDIEDPKLYGVAVKTSCDTHATLMKHDYMPHCMQQCYNSENAV